MLCDPLAHSRATVECSWTACRPCRVLTGGGPAVPRRRGGNRQYRPAAQSAGAHETARDRYRHRALLGRFGVDGRSSARDGHGARARRAGAADGGEVLAEAGIGCGNSTVSLSGGARAHSLACASQSVSPRDWRSPRTSDRGSFESGRAGAAGRRRRRAGSWCAWMRAWGRCTGAGSIGTRRRSSLVARGRGGRPPEAVVVRNSHGACRHRLQMPTRRWPRGGLAAANTEVVLCRRPRDRRSAKRSCRPVRVSRRPGPSLCICATKWRHVKKP